MKDSDNDSHIALGVMEPTTALFVDCNDAAMKLKVVAEGVETEAQLRFFRERSCDYAQGYRISPAIPADKFVSFVRSYLQMSGF